MASTKAYQARKRDIEELEKKIATLEFDFQNTLAELRNCESAHEIIADENKAITAEWKRLKIRCGILESYIRHAYWADLDNPVVSSEIPLCLKPFDAIKFSGGEPMLFPPKYEDVLDQEVAQLQAKLGITPYTR